MDFDEKTKHAWRRFCNGLKLDGTQRDLVLRLVRDLREELRKAEQLIYNANQTIDRLKRGE